MIPQSPNCIPEENDKYDNTVLLFTAVMVKFGMYEVNLVSMYK